MDDWQSVRPLTEALHINLRRTRQAIEHELNAARARVSNLGPDASPEQQAAVAAETRARIAELRAQVSAATKLHEEDTKRLKDRVQLQAALNQMASNGNADAALNMELLAAIATYFAESRRYPVALADLLARIPELRHLVELDLIAEEHALVDETIGKRRYEVGLKWCREHRAALVKAGSDIESTLQMLHYVELIMNEQDVDGAIQFARRAFGKPKTDMRRVYKVAGALYGPVKLKASEPAVLSTAGEAPTTDADLERALREAFREVNGRSRDTALLDQVIHGISTLKTAWCGHESPGATKCPTCDPMISTLVAEVPMAAHTRSVLDPDMVALPNNRVIGLSRIEDYTAKNFPDALAEGMLVCPDTGDRFKQDELQIVYAM